MRKEGSKMYIDESIPLLDALIEELDLLFRSLQKTWYFTEFPWGYSFIASEVDYRLVERVDPVLARERIVVLLKILGRSRWEKDREIVSNKLSQIRDEEFPRANSETVTFGTYNFGDGPYKEAQKALSDAIELVLKGYIGEWHM